jgi:Ca2+-dependent lipid-binding protein
MSSKITEEEAIMFLVTLLITVSDCQIRFARTGKANIVLITLPITVSDCQILFSRNGKANIVMITLPITVSDCHFFHELRKRILLSSHRLLLYQTVKF